MPASQGYLDFEERAAQRGQQAQNQQYMQSIMAQMAMRNQEAQRQIAARSAVSRGLPTLLGGPDGGGGIPMPGQPMPMGPGGGMPMPPPMAAPAAPPPGSLSPGGGNPQAQNPAPAPPPVAQAAPPAAAPAPQPIPPFRAMPTAPAPSGPPPGPGGIPMPGGPPPPDPLAPPKAMPSVAEIVQRMDKAGISPEQRLDALAQLEPILAASQKAELDHFKMIAGAQSAALRAATAFITANASQTRATTGVAAEERRTNQGNVRADQRQQEIDIKQQKEERLRGAANNVGGGVGKLKSTEFVYPKKEDGSADQSAEPIGIRGLSKTGKIIYLDAEGHQTPTLAGLTAKQSKGSQVSVRDSVRSNLVEGSALNATNRLNEIEKAHPGGTTSVLFGQDPKGITESAVHGVGRSMQGKQQQDIDAKWSSFIDEAIPVFTGGLRGSDAFRRFLIGQAPGPGTKPEIVAEKMRLFRENIKGTQRAFANKFKTDPQMWGSGVTRDQVQGGAGAAGGEERKTINGKSYVKKNGQWFEE